jgi:hypothetical protein
MQGFLHGQPFYLNSSGHGHKAGSCFAAIKFLGSEPQEREHARSPVQIIKGNLKKGHTRNQGKRWI